MHDVPRSDVQTVSPLLFPIYLGVQDHEMEHLQRHVIAFYSWGFFWQLPSTLS
jgi:hypothetical protein